MWYHSGKPPMLLRWVLVRDPHKCFEPQPLFSTHLDHTPEQSLTWFIRRWTVKVTLEEARGIWAWRRSVSGMREPLPEPPQRC
jgi:hypothetical protein